MRFASTLQRANVVFAVFLVLAFGAAVFASQSGTAQDLPEATVLIQGSVLGPEGSGIEAALVTLYDASFEVVDEQETDQDGAYRFLLVDPGTYVISIGADCCLRGSVHIDATGTNLIYDVGPVHLEARPPVESEDVAVISGQVTDLDTEVPVANAEVYISNYFDPTGQCIDWCYGYASFWLPTDLAGRFDLNVNPGTSEVRANAPEYDQTVGAFSVTDYEWLDVPLRDAYNYTAVIYGVAQNAQGQPVADAWIEAYRSYGYGGCHSYDDGLCSVPVQSSPAAGGEWTFEPDEYTYASMETGPDGEWEIRISAGSVEVNAYAQDHMDARAHVTLEPQDERDVDLELVEIPPASVTLKGRVTDASTGSGISDASVQVENQQWGTWDGASTDDDGYYELKTRPGYAIVTIQRHAWLFACAIAEPVSQAVEDEAASSSTVVEPAMTMVACEPPEPQEKVTYLPSTQSASLVADETRTLNAALVPRPSPSSTFEGYVLDAQTGDAIEGAAVSFYNEVTRDWGDATTDADGSYSIDVYAGYYSVRVWAPGHFDGVATLEIDDGQTKRADFELEVGQKRYGHWARGGYDVAVAESGSGGTGAGADANQGPPRPSDGQRAFAGSGGGLGPYRAPLSDVDADGQAPGVGVVFALGLMGLVGLVMRRRN